MGFPPPALVPAELERRIDHRVFVGRLLTPAHIGTYALPGTGRRAAHIAGYALAEIGPWLPFEEQEGRLARKSDAAAAHSEWGFQGEHRLRRVDFRDGLWLGR